MYSSNRSSYNEAQNEADLLKRGKSAGGGIWSPDKERICPIHKEVAMLLL
jgi:hypothetical protein